MPFATSRLTARHLNADDLPAVHQLLGNRQVIRWLGDDKPFSEAQTLEFLEATLAWYDDPGYATYALMLHGSERIIGLAGFFVPAQSVIGQPEIAYLLHPDAWGQGLAQEAGIAVIAMAAKLGLQALHAVIDEGNTASRAVAEKLGFTLLGLQPGPVGMPLCIYRCSVV